MDAIPNKISESSLIQIDLDDFLPQLYWKGIDISDFLSEGLILREQEFRNAVKNMDLNVYQDQALYIYCSTDAIFPEWAYLVISNALLTVTSQIFIGNLQKAQQQLLSKILSQMDYHIYQDKNLIIKGCGNSIVLPQHALQFFQGARPFANQIMFGEACSSVPIYKSSK